MIESFCILTNSVQSAFSFNFYASLHTGRIAEVEILSSLFKKVKQSRRCRPFITKAGVTLQSLSGVSFN